MPKTQEIMTSIPETQPQRAMAEKHRNGNVLGVSANSYRQFADTLDGSKSVGGLMGHFAGTVLFEAIVTASRHHSAPV
jgi:hypothetical protein